MAGSSPEDDSKPPATSRVAISDHLRQHYQQECESKFDSGSIMATDQRTAIASMLSLQSNAQHDFFAGAQHSQEMPSSSTSFLYSPYGSTNLVGHASSILPNAASPQVHTFEQDTAIVQQQRAILQQQLPFFPLPQEHFLQNPQPIPPYLGFADRERLFQQLQLQSQISTNNAFRDSQLVNQLGSIGRTGGLLDLYSNNSNSISSAVPYSGATAAAADIASVLPHFEREQAFAETVRNQTAHLQSQDFAESDPFAKPKVSRAKAKQKKIKEKGQPKRPLSAYNIFFQEERAKILRQIPDKKMPKRRNNKNPNRSDPHGKISFEQMAKKIGAAWQMCPEKFKAHYKEMAKKDTQRYQAEKEAWKSQQSAEMTQQQLLLQQQVDSQTMREYISHHEEQQQRKVDVKTTSKSSTGSFGGQRDGSLPSPDDDKSEEER